MKTYKKLIALALCLGLSVLASALLSPPVKGADKTTITYWHPWGGRWGKGHEDVIAKFNAANPRIKVDVLFVTAEEIRQKALLGIMAGTAPDVYTVWGPPDAYTFKDQFMPLSDLIAKDPDIKIGDYIPGSFEINSFRGVIYGMPLVSSSRALYYNKVAFRNAGLDPNKPPATWDELDAYAEKLTKKDNLGRYQQIGFRPWFGWPTAIWFWAKGGELYDNKTDKVTATHPKNIEAMDWIVSYAKKYNIEQLQEFATSWGTEANHPFITGQEAMSVRGIWDVAFFADYAPKLDYDVALPPRPRDGVYVADWTYTDSTFILKSTKNPKESWEYVKWLNRVPDWPIYTRDLPARYDILAHPEFQKDKLFVKIADFAKYSKALLDFPALQFYKDKIDAAVNEAIFQKKTSREALAEMQTVVQREVDRVLKK